MNNEIVYSNNDFNNHLNDIIADKWKVFNQDTLEYFIGDGVRKLQNLPKAGNYQPSIIENLSFNNAEMTANQDKKIDLGRIVFNYNTNKIFLGQGLTALKDLLPIGSEYGVLIDAINQQITMLATKEDLDNASERHHITTNTEVKDGQSYIVIEDITIEENTQFLINANARVKIT